MAAVIDHVMLIGTGAITGFVIVNLTLLARLAMDVIAARQVAESVVWPDPASLTAWTGEDWFTVTVMPVAFGRWGIAMCRDEAPRRAEAIELVWRERTERNARARAVGLAGQAASCLQHESVALVAR